MAYAKLDLDAEILDSTLPDDHAFAATLVAYFPKQAAETFAAELPPASPQARNHFHHHRQPHRQSGGPGLRRPHEGNVGRERRGSGARLHGGGRRLRTGSAQDPHRRAWTARSRRKCRSSSIPRSRRSCAGWACGFLPMSRPRTIWPASIALYRAGVEKLCARATRISFPPNRSAGIGGAHRPLRRARRARANWRATSRLLPLLGVAPEIAQLARTTGTTSRRGGALFRRRRANWAWTGCACWRRAFPRRNIGTASPSAGWWTICSPPSAPCRKILLAKLSRHGDAAGCAGRRCGLGAVTGRGLGAHPSLPGGAGNHWRFVYRQTDARQQPDT